MEKFVTIHFWGFFSKRVQDLDHTATTSQWLIYQVQMFTSFKEQIVAYLYDKTKSYEDYSPNDLQIVVLGIFSQVRQPRSAALRKKGCDKQFLDTASQTLREKPNWEAC